METSSTVPCGRFTEWHFNFNPLPAVIVEPVFAVTGRGHAVDCRTGQRGFYSCITRHLIIGAYPPYAKGITTHNAIKTDTAPILNKFLFFIVFFIFFVLVLIF